MIVNTSRSNIEVLGDIKEFKTSIDPKNIEFITTLLSSNLYSNPERSFIREIVSNAWDSHVEANNTDTPIIVKFTKNEEHTNNISIRDFGTGVSPERFKEIYCNIGSSTKRESNDYIGCFGIGRFAPLSCSSTVYITSYYNSTAYHYIMIKNGNSITINLVSKVNTKEANGLEVTIKNIGILDPYLKAISSIAFFPNVYVSGITTKYNDLKFKKFNHFAAASVIINDKILLGNVLYPCNNNVLSLDSQKFLRKINYTGTVIKFDIGELEITPNRENIIYTNSTIDKINKRIEDAKKELDEMILRKIQKNYDNLKELYETLVATIRYDPITDNFNTSLYLYSYDLDIDTAEIKYKNLQIDKNVKQVIRDFFHCDIINLKGVLYNGKFYQNKFPYKIHNNILNSYKNILMLQGVNKFHSVIKNWLYENYADYTIIKPFTKEDFRLYLYTNVWALKNCEYKNELIDYLYEYFISAVKVIDLTTDTNFIEYKKSFNNKKSSTTTSDTFILYRHYKGDYISRVHLDDIHEVMKYLSNLNKGIILSDTKDSNEWYGIATLKNFEYITARRDIVKYIEKLNPSYLVDKDKLLKEDLEISKLRAVQKCFENEQIFVVESNYLYNSVPINLKEEFKEIINLHLKLHNLDNESIKFLNKYDTIDEYTNKICKQYIKYKRCFKNICETFKLSPCDKLEFILINALILKTKGYRINYNTYYKIKNNNILKILCSH